MKRRKTADRLLIFSAVVAIILPRYLLLGPVTVHWKKESTLLLGFTYTQLELTQKHTILIVSTILHLCLDLSFMLPFALII